MNLFLDRGFDWTTSGDVVEKSDVSRAAFCRHFDMKEDLVFL
jgi:hypothetical protein